MNDESNKTTLTLASSLGLTLGDVITFAGTPTRWQRFKRWLLRLIGRYPGEPPLKQFVVTSISGNTLEIESEHCVSCHSRIGGVCSCGKA